MNRTVVLTLALLTGACMPPEWGANAIVTPYRKPVTARPERGFEDVSITNGDVTLKGWLFRTSAPRRGLIVYLHGIGDNRQSGIGIASRFVPQGYDVLAYDSRGHGDSGGSQVTFGYYEKLDLVKALDAIGAEQAILFGSSLGASVALQTAALDSRVIGVIAQSPFSDLRTIVGDRAPWFASRREVSEAIHIAEEKARFRADDASVLAVADRIRVPVLLIHGEVDRETSADHSRRILAALPSGVSKELVIVPGAGHNDTLTAAATWARIEDWLSAIS